ncbi:LOW QUALITY PROTEIN: protein IQ-DOMAIN 33-like [Spinacia oleracea]|uniref:LOW QUALITY PROTEIN: protein IQ-DOMAIN 33-like n=1 Tax=Spinacia oleracea TaxID=3562 RepID=A0ABM3QR66_SPIOL|nr:LOW QUALITY PROTEIN: protein IQ-DOMAIN 33-like [Spinacia oleracea]
MARIEKFITVRSLRESTDFQNDFEEGMKSPGKESMATSIEVQTGNSIGVVSIQEEDTSASTKLHHKLKSSAYKPKEDWNDSTLDSTKSKMRIQNRLEAMTRRERALAYAFSQQLRICSKKKHTKFDPNMGWSWLERWMATRQIEVPLVEEEDYYSKQLTENEAVSSTKARPFLRKKFLDLSFEEKESCGSNEIPVQVDTSTNPSGEDKHGYDSPRNRLKNPNSISRTKTVPTYHNQKGYSKSKLKEIGEGNMPQGHEQTAAI